MLKQGGHYNTEESMQYQLVVQSPFGRFKGKPIEMTEEQHAENLGFLERMAQGGSYLSFKDEDGNVCIFPGKFLQQQCVLQVQEVTEEREIQS